MRIKKITALLLSVILILSSTACDKVGGDESVATGTDAPTVAVADIQTAFTDAFTSVYGDFTNKIDYDMSHFDSVLGDNYSLLFHVTIDEENPSPDAMDDYYIGINRIGTDYCFEIIYLTAIEFIKCGNGYAFFENPDGFHWEHDDTVRTTREHLKRIYNGLAYQVIAPYNSATSALKRNLTTATYLDRLCNLYRSEYESEYEGKLYSYNGEFYIDEKSGICMYSIVTMESEGATTVTTIECQKIELGTATLNYTPDPATYL